jgi:hypothetical protein
MMKVNQDTYARILKDLIDGPITAYDAVEASGIHIVTAQSLMRCLKKHKAVHIVAWDCDKMGRDTTPVYAIGGGRDKPRNKDTPAVRQARSRAKKKMMLLNKLEAEGGITGVGTGVVGNLSAGGGADLSRHQAQAAG